MSDTSSEPDEGYPDLPAGQKWLEPSFAHYSLLRDAEGGVVNRKTRLVALHTAGTDTVKASIRNLTDIAEPWCKCTILASNDWPITSGEWQFRVTFDRLLIAPALRLECAFDETSRFYNHMSRHGTTGVHGHTPGRPAVTDLQLILEFHFLPTGDGLEGLQAFQVLGDEVKFVAHGATSEGFNKIPHHMHDDPTVCKLKAMLNPPACHDVRLRLLDPPDSIARRLFSMRASHLPGGSAEPLDIFRETSYGHRRAEWEAFGTSPGSIPSPLAMMQMNPPLPMTPLSSRDTFSTTTQARIELSHSIHALHQEEVDGLKLWATGTHTGQLYAFEDIAYMVVNFGPFNKLGSATDHGKFRLNDRIHVVPSWRSPHGKRNDHKLGGIHCTAPVQLRPHDAVFMIPGINVKKFPGICQNRDDWHADRFDVKCDPHISSFAISNQLKTADALANPRNAFWRKIVLNQLHDDIETIDIATKRKFDPQSKPREISDEAVRQAMEADGPKFRRRIQDAYQEMLDSRKWNPEQLEALKTVRSAVGGIVLITGPAGTGKTLVQQAICAFAYLLGLHVLAVSPANSTCADFMRKLQKLFPHIKATRVFPASAELDIHGNTNGDPVIAPAAGHVGGESMGLPDFDLARAAMRNHKYEDGRDCGLQTQVLEAAYAGDRVYKSKVARQGRVNAWAVLQKCIKDRDAGTFDMGSAEDRAAYTESYANCKRHFLAHQRLVCTTTGNVACTELALSWAIDDDDLGVRCAGVLLVVDEACKDQEIATLSSIFVKKHKLVGVVMVGDEKQLEPTVSSQGKGLIFNHFPERAGIPLLSRLKRGGFPCVELVEQHRMNFHVAKWPSKVFYDDKLRHHKDCYHPLAEAKPDLANCLRTMFCAIPPAGTRGTLTDEQLRNAYFEVSGTRRPSSNGTSWVVREHIHFFFERIFWHLNAYYRGKTAEHVMVIAAYGEACARWSEASNDIRRKNNLALDDMPTICTIDSSQGREATIVIIDCSVQTDEKNYTSIGFVDDPRRMNVAMTRAKEVRIFIGGRCAEKRVLSGIAYVDYYWHCVRNDLRWVVDSSLITSDGSTWLKDVVRAEVILSRTLGDDVARR
ncbi:hypothetical protein LTR86_008345 [Recurvomyces mirabilis]|nr:hypothetical protein LTR86_008345 [Recurvomyces mirabilis]